MEQWRDPLYRYPPGSALAHLLLSLFVCLAALGSQAPAVQAAEARPDTGPVTGPVEPGQTLPLAQALNPDGTLHLNAGFRGSLDARGWQIISQADEPPRFAPLAADEALAGDESSSGVEPLAPGDENWSNQFSGYGVSDTVNAMVIDGNDNLYLGGNFTSAGGTTVNRVTRWDGTAWFPLGSGMNGTVRALAQDALGNLYAAGEFTTAGGVSATRIAKWDGSSWSPLGSGLSGTVRALAIDESGNLYAGGDFTNAGGVSASRVAKWNGTAWSSMAVGLDGTVEALVWDSLNDRLYAGGWFTKSGSTQVNRVARWNGTAWSALGSGVNAVVYALAMDNGSNLYAGGWFTAAGGVSANYVAQWNGSAWSDLAGGTSAALYALAVDQDGNVFAGGDFASAGGVAASRIARWNGSAWSALGSGTNSRVEFIIPLGGGEIYAGGSFGQAGGINANRIARWDGATWTALGGGMGAVVYALAFDGNGNMYAGGNFLTAGGISASRVAKWDGDRWSPLGVGVNNVVRALAVDASGNLYAGGEFSVAGGVSVSKIAKWNGIAWSTLGSGMNATVRALTVDWNGNLYAGGDFSTAGGNNAGKVAKWNGTAWSALGNGVNGTVEALAWDSDNNHLYVGGWFTNASGVNASRVARWNGTNWSALGTGLSAIVRDLALDGNGNLYAGGDFTNAGSTPVNYVAKWDGASWSALGSGVSQGVDGVAIDANGDLYVGGFFTTASGTSASRIARWDGSSWWAMGSGVNNIVRVLLASEDLFVGGEFTLAGGKSSAFMGRWAVNEPPIDILLSADHIAENRPSGTTVGTLSASDPNVGDSHTFTLVSTAPCPGPDNTAFTINGSQLRAAQVFNYEVDNSYAICIRVTDSQGGTYEKAFTITVDNVNEAPITVNDAHTTDEDVPLIIPAPGVLSNDSDPENDTLTAALQTPPAHGTVTVGTNGAFTYYPQIGYNGSDSFTYLARDGALDTPGTVDITINPVNNNVTAVNDTYTTAEDAPLDVPAPGVLANDSDPDYDPLSAALDTPPAHGSLDLNSDGSFNYVPFENYHGTDFFIYSASDGTFSDRATVTITITPSNDPPQAVDNSYTTGEDQAITRGAPGVLVNDSDVDGDALTAALNDPPAHGTVDLNPNGSFTYTPAANYFGSDSFTYTASDGNLTDDATVNLTITPRPDPPQANNNNYTTPEDIPLNVPIPGVLGNDSDPDGDPLTAAVKTSPAHGTLTLNANGSFTYTPAANYHGSDSFTYTASDGDLTDDATVNLTVSAGNDPPQASDDSYATTRDTPKTVTAPGVLGNDSDLDGDPLTAQVASPPSHGSLTLNANGSFTYTPAAGYTGSDSFTYRASDGKASDTATVTLNVNADNHRPQAVNDSYTAIQDTPLQVGAPGVLGNDSDPDSDNLNATLKDAPTHGTLELRANGSFTYTPQAGYTGPDTFTYTASDGDMSDTATVAITVLIDPEEGFWIYIPVTVGSYPN